MKNWKCNKLVLS